MKGGIVFVLGFFFLASFVVAEVITGNVIATGEVTSNELGMVISVVGPPSLVILSPLNETYLRPNISLDYVVGDNDAIWYSLDGGANVSATFNTRLNVGEGIHVLYLYANNSYGTSSKSIVFSMDRNRLELRYGDFNGSKRGSSTDFEEFGYESLQSLENIVLENSDYGKISFDGVINITDDLDNSDNVVDIDSHINISATSISLDSVALPNFNKSATLYFYGLSFSDPRVLVDDEVCPASLCNVISYLGGTLEFSVSHFTTYSVEETPEDEVGANPSSGRGGSRKTEETFLVDTEQIAVEVRQGRVTSKKITITNKENHNLNINIRADVFWDTIVFSHSSFVLGPLESKEIFIDFIARENRLPGIYMGRIIVGDGNFEKEILFSTVVKPKLELFDVSVSILEDYEEVDAGKSVFSEIELFNLGETGRIDAEIKYFIKDAEGEIILSEEEVKAVETSLNFIKGLRLPSDLSPGKYIIYVEVSYSDQVIGASAWFSVLGKDSTENPFSKINIPQLLANLIMFIIVILIVWIVMRMGNSNRKRKR